jgi:hypothetical protein
VVLLSVSGCRSCHGAWRDDRVLTTD